MMRRLLNQWKGRKWMNLFLDFLVVIFGILFAFQIDRAYESWKERQAEKYYLQRLLVDLEGDMEMYKQVIARTGVRLDEIDLLNKIIEDPQNIRGREEQFIFALEHVTWRNFPVINGYTYNEMLTTGTTTLLQSETLRKRLSEYYSFIEDTERLSFGEDDQDRFRVETLGILSADMLKFVEDGENYPLDVSAEASRRIAQEFADRKQAHPWMGRLAKYHVLMARRARDFTEMAQELQSDIRQRL